MDRSITEEAVKQMKLFDIVNYLQLTIYPPGGSDALDFWIQETSINVKSIILDVGCSTGFFSRYIAQKTGCMGYGIDIDPNAISAAEELKDKAKLTHLLNYSVQDVSRLYIEGSLKFSHILFANALAFVKENDRPKAISLMSHYLNDHGFLLVNSFFYERQPDPKILEELYSICDLKVSKHHDYAYYNALFESHFRLVTEGDLVDISSYRCTSDILRENIRESLRRSINFQSLPNNIQRSLHERLLEIRLQANENQRYLNSKVQIWEKY